MHWCSSFGCWKSTINSKSFNLIAQVNLFFLFTSDTRTVAMCYVVVVERQDWSRIGWMAKWSLPGLYMIGYGTVKNILKFLPFCEEYKEWEYLKKCPASHQQLICVCLCFFISLKFSALEVSCLEFKRWRQFQNIFFSSVP